MLPTTSPADLVVLRGGLFVPQARSTFCSTLERRGFDVHIDTADGAVACRSGRLLTGRRCCISSVLAVGKCLRFRYEALQVENCFRRERRVRLPLHGHGRIRGDSRAISATASTRSIALRPRRVSRSSPLCASSRGARGPFLRRVRDTRRRRPDTRQVAAP